MEKAKISALYKYPVKSLAGVLVSSMGFTTHGPNYDRIYMIIKENGDFISQRTHPKLARLVVVLSMGNVFVANPANQHQVVLREDELAGPQKMVRIHKEVCEAHLLPNRQADDFFSDFLGEQCRVVRYYPGSPRNRTGERTGQFLKTTFTDGYPATVMTIQALWDINLRLDEAGYKPVSAKHFRPTIVIDESSDAHAEDRWLFAKGNRGVTLRFEKHCDRCLVPNIDPGTGNLDRDVPVTKILQKYRRIHADKKDGRVYFASNFAIEIAEAVTDPYLKVGDELEVIYQEAKAA